ncbi:MAG TPA: S41 family peptidase [Verrucomicrobiae bacterium]|jgi:carboxyl-terminal processing protease|nr:S41 family peptidase [Verrucomicrobiae bacterium]
MKRRLIFSLVAVVLALNLAIGAKIYLSSAHAADAKDSPDANLEIFADVLQKVRTSYVDGTNLTYHALVQSALKGMVGSLDPHSEFLDVDDYRQLQDDTEGQFGGLGLEVAMKDGFVTVIAPMDDSPGFRAGILSGDRIVKVEGKSVEKTPLENVVKQLRGEPDTQVTMTIQRPSSGVTKDFTLTRAIINMEMVKDINGKKEFPLGDDKIGYVRITEFGDKTGDELEAALQKLKGQGMKALVLDLRFNPGGLLDEAVNVCGKFLPRGQLVVTTEGRNAGENSVNRAAGHGDELKGEPIVVLVNLGSASAAEIVTGCLQDLHRGIILGEKTFGKGSVQSIFPLDDGSALKLTVAKYYTPSHKVIHEHGITPDIFVLMSDEAQAALLISRSPGGLESLDAKDRARIKDSSDIQLDRAEDLLKGILLYGQLSKPEKVAAK